MSIWTATSAESLMEFAKRDDCLIGMVPSDLRELLGRLIREEKAHEQTMIERDEYHEWADRLAHHIGGEEIGEHSNLNNPWQNALGM